MVEPECPLARNGLAQQGEKAVVELRPRSSLHGKALRPATARWLQLRLVRRENESPDTVAMPGES